MNLHCGITLIKHWHFEADNWLDKHDIFLLKLKIYVTQNLVRNTMSCMWVCACTHACMLSVLTSHPFSYCGDNIFFEVILEFPLRFWEGLIECSEHRLCHAVYVHLSTTSTHLYNCLSHQLLVPCSLHTTKDKDGVLPRSEYMEFGCRGVHHTYQV